MHSLPRSLAMALALVFVASAAAQSTWTVGRTNLPGVSQVTGVAYGNGRFVVTTSGAPGPGVAWSKDGTNWQDFTPQSPAGGGALLFIRGAFYSLANSALYRSTDAVKWTRIFSSAPGGFYSGIASDGSGLILGTTDNSGTFLISSDLVTWRTSTPMPNTGQPGQRCQINHLAYGAGRYVVSYYVTTGEGTTSTQVTPYAASTADGATWTSIPAIAFTSGLAGGPDRVVAIVGTYAFVSTDGVTFNRVAQPLPADAQNPAKLFHAGGRFFVARSLLSSADGVTWSYLGSLTKSISSALWGIAYGNGRYLAGGFDSTPGTGLIDFVAVLQAPGPPVIATAPASRTLVEGQRAVLSISVENADTTTTFQWRRNGTPIAGATGALYAIDSASPSIAGRYTIEVRNALGLTTSDADITVVPLNQAGRIVNLSVLTSLDRPGDSFTVGFVVGGASTSGTKSLLARAGGPSLAIFGVAAPNPDPKLELWSAGAKVGENDNWSGAPATAAAIAQLGAFAFLSGDSKDAALVATVAKGDNNVIVSANGGATGAVIAELYDATSSSAITATTPRLINVSILKNLSAGSNLAAGFVIGGATEKTVLVRAIGPSLATFGVADANSDPTLALYRSGTPTPLATNDNWGGAAELSTAFAGVGAFGLAASSKDSALLVTLQPGSYTAQVSGVGNTIGVALIEVYEVP